MAFDYIADPDAQQSPSPLPGPTTFPTLTFPEDVDGANWAQIQQPLRALAGEVAYLKRAGQPLIDVERFRQNPSYSDRNTIQDALDSGLPLWFPKRTYTLGNGQTVINRLCHFMMGNGTTFKLGNGAIVNTDASRGNFTPFMQVRGVLGFTMCGTWLIDGNRGNQTYPATAGDFGRGTLAIGSAGRRACGIIEFLPGDDNATPCRDLLIHGQIEIKEGYLNGLVFWQTERTTVRGVYTHDNTINGIAAEGVTAFLLDGCRHYRDGASTAYPSTKNDGDRAGLQIREIPGDFTAANLGIPHIPSASGQDQVNVDVNVSNCFGDECEVESWFMRFCFPGRISNSMSRNVGYMRHAAASFHCAHFWGESGIYEFTNLVGIQLRNNLVLGYQPPDGMVCQTYDDAGLTGNIASGFLGRSVVSNVRLVSGFDPSHIAQANYYRGVRIFSECDVSNLYVEGATAEGLRIENDVNFNLLPPRNVTARGCVFDGINSSAVIRVVAYQSNTLSGAADGLVFDDIRVRNARTTLFLTDDHAIIDFSGNMSSFAVTCSATNLDFDCLNDLQPQLADQTGNFNAVRFRVGAGSKLRVHFTKCMNSYTPVRVSGSAGFGGGLNSIEITGRMSNVRRCILVDATEWGADAVSLAADFLAEGVNNEMFTFIGFTSRKIGSVSMRYRASGAATCRTFPSGSGNITTTPGSFFAEAKWFCWGPTLDDYGSAAPLTNVADMRRTFSDATQMNAAAPYYRGEIVRKADDSTFWIGIDSRPTITNGWRQLV